MSMESRVEKDNRCVNRRRRTDAPLVLLLVLVLLPTVTLGHDEDGNVAGEAVDGGLVRVAVVGAGIGGVGTSYFLHELVAQGVGEREEKEEVRITLYEGSGKPGGRFREDWVRKESEGSRGKRIELGAMGVSSFHQETVKLLDKFNVDYGVGWEGLKESEEEEEEDTVFGIEWRKFVPNKSCFDGERVREADKDKESVAFVNRKLRLFMEAMLGQYYNTPFSGLQMGSHFRYLEELFGSGEGTLLREFMRPTESAEEYFEGRTTWAFRRFTLEPLMEFMFGENLRQVSPFVVFHGLSFLTTKGVSFTSGSEALRGRNKKKSMVVMTHGFSPMDPLEHKQRMTWGGFELKTNVQVTKLTCASSHGEGERHCNGIYISSDNGNENGPYDFVILADAIEDMGNIKTEGFPSGGEILPSKRSVISSFVIHVIAENLSRKYFGGEQYRGMYSTDHTNSSAPFSSIVFSGMLDPRLSEPLTDQEWEVNRALKVFKIFASKDLSDSVLDDIFEGFVPKMTNRFFWNYRCPVVHGPPDLKPKEGDSGEWGKILFQPIILYKNTESDCPCHSKHVNSCARKKPLASVLYLGGVETAAASVEFVVWGAKNAAKLVLNDALGICPRQ
eukprot:Nk52_evm98s208 gene=Nk52_evmTU98s208